MKVLTLVLTLSLFHFELCAARFAESGKAPWGVDAELVDVKKNKIVTPTKPLSVAQIACRSMIRFFQQYISPIDGPRSSYFPSSSQYTLESIEKYGVLEGIARGCDRLLRENGDVWVYEVTERQGIERKLDPVR